MAEYIKLLSGLRSRFNYFDEKDRPYYEALSEAIARKPVVHGHWKVRRGNYNEEFECSVCRHISKDGGNYCGNCGARMDEVEDDG